MVELLETRLTVQTARKQVGQAVERSRVEPVPMMVSGKVGGVRQTVPSQSPGWAGGFAFVGREGQQIQAPQLAGRVLDAVESRGKCVLIAFRAEGHPTLDMVVHMGQNAAIVVLPTAGVQEHVVGAGAWERTKQSLGGLRGGVVAQLDLANGKSIVFAQSP